MNGVYGGIQVENCSVSRGILVECCQSHQNFLRRRLLVLLCQAELRTESIARLRCRSAAASANPKTFLPEHLRSTFSANHKPAAKELASLLQVSVPSLNNPVILAETEYKLAQR